MAILNQPKKNMMSRVKDALFIRPKAVAWNLTHAMYAWFFVRLQKALESRGAHVRCLNTARIVNQGFPENCVPGSDCGNGVRGSGLRAAGVNPKKHTQNLGFGVWIGLWVGLELVWGLGWG